MGAFFLDSSLAENDDANFMNRVAILTRPPPDPPAAEA